MNTLAHHILVSMMGPSRGSPSDGLASIHSRVLLVLATPLRPSPPPLVAPFTSVLLPLDASGLSRFCVCCCWSRPPFTSFVLPLDARGLSWSVTLATTLRSDLLPLGASGLSSLRCVARPLLPVAAPFVGVGSCIRSLLGALSPFVIGGLPPRAGGGSFPPPTATLFTSIAATWESVWIAASECVWMFSVDSCMASLSMGSPRLP